MTKTWHTYAEYILATMAKLHRIQDRGDVTTDEILYAASLRHLQTLAEATQRLPDQLKQVHPNIPWRDISGFRNVLVHNYLGDIDPQAISTVLAGEPDPVFTASANRARRT